MTSTPVSPFVLPHPHPHPQRMAVLITPAPGTTPPATTPAATATSGATPSKTGAAGTTPIVGTAAPAAPDISSRQQPEHLTKRLAWDTIQNDKVHSGGIWSKMHASESLDAEDDKELAEMFAVVSPAPAVVAKTAKAAAPPPAPSHSKPKPYVPVFSVGAAPVPLQQQHSHVLKTATSAPSANNAAAASTTIQAPNSASISSVSVLSATTSATPPPFSPRIPEEYSTPRPCSPSSHNNNSRSNGPSAGAAPTVIAAPPASSSTTPILTSVTSSSSSSGAPALPPHKGTRNAYVSPEHTYSTLSGSGSSGYNSSSSPLTKPRSGSDPPPPLLRIQTNLNSPSASSTTISASGERRPSLSSSSQSGGTISVSVSGADGAAPVLVKRRSRTDSLKAPLAAAVAAVKGGEVHLNLDDDEKAHEQQCSKMTLGEILARNPPQTQRNSTTTSKDTHQLLLPQSGAGPEHYTRTLGAAANVASIARPLTPQPRGRTLGLHSEVKIDADLMPNFLFLKDGKTIKNKMKAATLPLPTNFNSSPSLGPQRVPSPSVNSSSVSQARTPRNMELAALHAHNISPSPRGACGSSRGDGGEHAPRRWTVSPMPPDGGGDPTPRGPSSTSSGGAHHPTNLQLNILSPAVAGASSGHNMAAGGIIGPSASYNYGDSMKSPPSALSPVVLGSGCLADVLSTTTRVVERMGAEGGVVALDDDAIVALVARHRHDFARAAAHEEGEFVTQMLARKYNSDVGGHDNHGASDALNARAEDAAQVLSARSLRIAVPFAPAEWYFSPSNLSLVVSYHLVLASLDWGLDQVPPPPQVGLMPALALLPTGTDPSNADEAVAAAQQAMARSLGARRTPYNSLDLAAALTSVVRANPHAFDAERLTKMDPIRLGSWLQPHIFAAALRDNPDLSSSSSEPLLSSPTSARALIPFTYPNLDERARVLREVGFTLLRFFNGSATKVVEQCEHSAAKLVETLTQHFPSWRDQSVYRGRQVFLYTRAQSFVRQLWVAFHGHALGSFNDMHDLFPRADALLPPMLHALGLLRYSRELRNWVDRRTDLASLPADVELELRCASAHAVLRIAQVMKNLDIHVLPIQIDLWLRLHFDPLSHSLRPLWPDDSSTCGVGIGGEYGSSFDDGDEEARQRALAHSKNLRMLRMHHTSSVWY